MGNSKLLVVSFFMATYFVLYFCDKDYCKVIECPKEPVNIWRH